MEHFSDNEIIAYSKDQLSQQQLLKISKHLGECRKCDEQLFRLAPRHSQILFERVINAAEGASIAENYQNYPWYFNWRIPVTAFAGIGLLILFVLFAFQPIKFGTENEPAEIAQMETSDAGGSFSLPTPPTSGFIENMPLNSDAAAAQQPETVSPAPESGNLPQDKTKPLPKTGKPKPEIAQFGAAGGAKKTQRLQNNPLRAEKADNELNLRGCSQGEEASLTLISPINNAAFADNTGITFSWKAVPGATSYWLAVRDTQSNIILDARDLTTTSFTKSLPKGDYLWKIVPVFSSSNQTVNSPFTYFSVGIKNPKPPKMIPQSKKMRC